MSSLDKVLGRLDDLDSVNLTILVQRLARERRLLETIFNTVQEGILVINTLGDVEYSNQSANTMIGLRPGKSPANLFRLVPGLVQSLPIYEGQEATAVSREIELNYPEHRYVRLYMMPFMEDDTQMFAIILTDVTSDKISTEELIENEKTSSIVLLAGSVAHEIGNPLNSISIQLQLLQRQIEKQSIDAQARDKVNHSIAICCDEIARLDGIVQNFLKAIRPNEPHFQKINLVQVLEDVLHLQTQELENLNVDVKVEVMNEIPPVSADANQIKQVFFNIIKNSMEAMRAGGSMSIRFHCGEKSIVIHFTDNGKGISQEDVARIFQPYFTTKDDGNGLGMLIIRRILRAHGAQIGIGSSENKGTVVTLEFPLHRIKLLEGNDN